MVGIILQLFSFSSPLSYISVVSPSLSLFSSLSLSTLFSLLFFSYLTPTHPVCFFLSLSLSRTLIFQQIVFSSLLLELQPDAPSLSLSLALFLPLSLPLLDIITGASHAPTFQPANEITEPPSVHSHITHTPNTHTPSHIYVHTYAKMPVAV